MNRLKQDWHFAKQHLKESGFGFEGRQGQGAAKQGRSKQDCTAERPGSDGALPRRRPSFFVAGVFLLLLPAPLFLIFEVWQLVVAERYLGVKQIGRGADPRALGLGELAAFVWSSTILVYWFWMLALLVLPVSRVHGLGLLVLTVIGFSLRRGSPLKWVLMILTFEGALRIALLVWLCAGIWRRL